MYPSAMTARERGISLATVERRYGFTGIRTKDRRHDTS